MGKSSKQTRKFAASGQLKKTIQARKRHQEVKKRMERRKPGSSAASAAKGKGKGKGKQPTRDGDADEGDGEGEDGEEVGLRAGGKAKKAKAGKGVFKGMSVDDFLGGGFLDGGDDENEDEDEEGGAMDDVSDLEDEDEDEDEDAEGSEAEDEDENFSDVDELDAEGEAHLFELSKLAEKDPEFYKYLQENDQELLDFNPDNLNADVDDVDVDMSDAGAEEDEKAPVLTMEEVKKWSKALLEHRSLRALRKLLIAFRAAAHMNEEDQVLAWTIDSSKVYNKLITTALRYTPVVLDHHCPVKELPNGKFKPPTQTPKLNTLTKLLLSYFHNVLHLLSQLTDVTLITLALTESAKLIPYVIGSRKAVKAYLKTCLECWASGEDEVRIKAVFALRRVMDSGDEGVGNLLFKNLYLTLLRSCKSTRAHTLPSINLMKNSASEIYTMDHAMAYQHAFGYIRQLAIHLRNSMRVKSKEAYKQVYNWQYVHCVDFWSIVLARACDREAQIERGGEASELRALIYPLVQVTVGAIKLIPNSRSYPLHLHLARSLLHLSRHTLIHIPLTPYLLPIILSTLSSTSRPKASTLRPLDFETSIRAPQQYLKTRVYNEGLAEEASFLLAEYLTSTPVHASVAFPEVTVPLTMMLRKAVKASKDGKDGKWRAKEAGTIKALVERVEESAQWVDEKRKGVGFAPGRLGEVETWEESMRAKVEEESPLGKYVRVLRKTREKRRKLMEKARGGEDEILSD